MENLGWYKCLALCCTFTLSFIEEDYFVISVEGHSLILSTPCNLLCWKLTKKFLLFVRKKAPLKDFWYLLHHFTWHQRLASLGLLYCFPDLSLEAAAVYQCVWKLLKKSHFDFFRDIYSASTILAGKFKYIANRHFLHLHFTLSENCSKCHIWMFDFGIFHQFLSY